ncbi:MAG: acyl-ACP--UDP-N-acetylglucosamine O-acyltransferase [Candidatus Marinimicrobia bacterium]|nr:acyl-ACP--UDP-N-acetylglucosamine O-acyltransferase [Candidatus Neomarinimicrobiota bacterium]
MATNIHPSAIVDSKAQIGENVTIDPFVIIEDNVVIGDGTEIKSSAVIKSGARIGKDCRIFQSAVVSEIPQDLKFEGESTLLEIGDRTTVREFCTLNRGTSELGKSSIGNDCLLMAYVHIAHDCIVGDKSILANGVQLAGHASIGYHVTIGGMTPVHQFCNVGDHAFVGGGYRVVQDVPPYILATGEPLKFAGVNNVGLRRRGFSAESRMNIKRAYKKIFYSDLNTSQAIESIKSDVDQTEEVKTILNFIENSNRGLI